MATAAPKSYASSSASPDATVGSDSVSVQFVIGHDNGGDYLWTPLERDGNALARSLGFAS